MLELGLGLRLGLRLVLFSALADMFRTRSPVFDRLQRRNNRHGLKIKVNSCPRTT